jgi:endonuclease-3
MDTVSFIVNKLSEEFGTPDAPLTHKNAYELLVAVILSAQTTDAQVNKISPELFKAFPTPEILAEANVQDIEDKVKTLGFYKTKAKNLKACAKRLVSEYNSKVPDSISELITLAGVGRKTANVVLHQWYNKSEGFVVDTHVGRIAVRLGLTKTKNSKDAINIEKNLMQVFESKDWGNVSLWFVFHGRKTCGAKKAFCDRCSLASVCPSKAKVKGYVEEK